jgi:hypothetical protein
MLANGSLIGVEGGKAGPPKPVALGWGGRNLLHEVVDDLLPLFLTKVRREWEL